MVYKGLEPEQVIEYLRNAIALGQVVVTEEMLDYFQNELESLGEYYPPDDEESYLKGFRAGWHAAQQAVEKACAKMGMVRPRVKKLLDAMREARAKEK